MCTGLELLIGGLTAASSFATMAAKPAAPPAPQMPAATPDAAKEAGAKVTLGTEDEDKRTSGLGTGNATKRTTQQTVGGLGRGGMAI